MATSTGNSFEDIEEAQNLLTAARHHVESMPAQDITGDYLNAFETAIRESTTDAGLPRDESKNETSEAEAAAKALPTCLQEIQSAAKAKLKEDSKSIFFTKLLSLQKYLTWR